MDQPFGKSSITLTVRISLEWKTDCAKAPPEERESCPQYTPEPQGRIDDLRVSSEDLEYDPDCPLKFESGKVWVKDKRGNTLEVRYACDSSKELYNGKLVDTK